MMMKFRYLFLLATISLAFFVGCSDEDQVTLLDEIRVSSSYVALPVDGGSSSITLTASQDWTLEKVTTDKDKVEWLSVSNSSGNAGEFTINFTAEKTINGRTAEVLIKSAGATQRVNIIQGLPKVSELTVAQALAVEDGVLVRVTGVCTKIDNTEYGNWYLEDETGSIYIYGTLDKKGNKKNFLSLGLEVGDEITVESPRSSYKGVPQLVDVTVLKINKSLLKVDTVENPVLPVEGGEFIAHLTSKGQGVSVEIPEDAKSWLSISSIVTKGTSSVIKFKALANEGGDRSTTIVFKTTDGKKNYSAETSISQKGAIVEASIADFLAAEVGETQYRLSGVITRIADTKYGNLDIRDYSGTSYVYGIEDFQDKDLKVGDIITIVGKRAEYKGNPQVGSATLENKISVVDATVTEVLGKEDSNNGSTVISVY
ncbi:MAG: BACON domain-containing protein [Fermentimonas sp.]|jgi:RPA family protein